MKNKSKHVMQSYFRDNFDINEGPYNEINRPEDEDLDEYKTKPISKRHGHKKLAVIRGGDIRTCPFGLPINIACKNVGDTINDLIPLDVIENENEKDRLTKANKLVYINNKTGKRCPYADKIADKFNKVDCDYGDGGAGEQSAAFKGSPVYPSTFYGLGWGGLFDYPLGFSEDTSNSTYRNLPFGLYSIQGKFKALNVKFAKKIEQKIKNIKKLFK